MKTKLVVIERKVIETSMTEEAYKFHMMEQNIKVIKTNKLEDTMCPRCGFDTFNEEPNQSIVGDRAMLEDGSEVAVNLHQQWECPDCGKWFEYSIEKGNNRITNVALLCLRINICPIPLHPNSKLPKIKWGDYQNKLPSTELVRSWFSEPCNIGVILSNGLFVIDFDSKLDYESWVKSNRDLSETYTVSTGRGFHVYFRGDVNNIPHSNGEHKTSGYVVIPPSVNQDGIAYSVVKNLKVANV